MDMNYNNMNFNSDEMKGKRLVLFVLGIMKILAEKSLEIPAGAGIQV